MPVKGQLIKDLPINIILSMVEGETTVPASLLLMEEEFVKLLYTADTAKQVFDWVDNNY